MLNLLNRIWGHLTFRRRLQVSILCFFVTIASIVELLNIGSIIPFLAIIASPEEVFNNPLFAPVIQAFQFKSPSQMLLPAMAFFVLFVAFTNLFRAVVLWVSTRLSFAIGADLSLKAYQTSLNQPYSIHVSRNSSEVISGIYKIDSVVTVINQTFILINSTLMTIVVLITIFILNPKFSSVFIFLFGSIYFLISLLTRVRLLTNSERAANSSRNLAKLMQESLGGIRDILLDDSQNLHSFHFHKADLLLRRARGNINILSNIPRYIVETFGVFLIILLVYWVTNESQSFVEMVPILGAFAIGAQRLLPVLQQGYSAATVIQGEKFALKDVLLLLENSESSSGHSLSLAPIKFTDEIRLSHVCFKYCNSRLNILSDINLIIKSGEKIGIIGKTGCGKSTFIDLLIGLLLPTSGSLIVDGVVIEAGNVKSWQKLIALVPQSIYLTDGSIAKNIAMGVPEECIDMQAVMSAARMAGIANDINGWDQGYETLVGERGARLSGGQRQRIGLARAFYKKPKILILDEATSALDVDTEKRVMNSIDEYKSGDVERPTILIIAHRLETLKYCEKIIKLDGGNIVSFGTYDDVIGI